jgi:DNA polymerase-3 subunit epsilon
MLPAARPFVAIDFETADYGPDSACAVGLVRVEGDEIVARAHALIRPPRPRVIFQWIHGISWAMVKDAPKFGEVWRQHQHMLEGAGTLVAHNAGFDRRVLEACCALYRMPKPSLPFACTVRMAKLTWGQRRNDLASVCARLGIRLQHHDALSDAEACAQIALRARAEFLANHL